VNHPTIAHIDTQKTWRGGERQVLELMKRLDKAGLKNILICNRSSEISHRALEACLDIVHLPLRGEWDVVSALRIRSLVKKRHVDILHAHTSHAHTLALLASWRMPEVKLVVSRRVDFHVRGFFSRTLKYGKRIDKIITVSDAIKRVLIEDGIAPGRIETIRSGFVTGEFKNRTRGSDIRKQFKIGPDSIVVVTVAALAPHKAHQVLLKAASRVLKVHTDVKFLLAGEGETRPLIERDIRNLGIGDSVLLLGFVEDVGSVYRAADIFALSSEEEGLCSSLLDAMYFKLPVVATSAGGIPELVRDGVNGYIVPVNDYLLFADRLNLLIEEGGRRKKMGMRSAEILKQHTVESTVEKTLAVYNDLVGQES